MATRKVYLTTDEVDMAVREFLERRGQKPVSVKADFRWTDTPAMGDREYFAGMIAEVEVTEYEKAELVWGELWVDLIKDNGYEWKIPWLDHFWRDGNPIFSACSLKLKRGVRILHNPDSSDLIAHVGAFGEGEDKIEELVLHCGTEPKIVKTVSHLLKVWIIGG